ncbi:MAG TPA: acyl-CoA dehydrogenase family protein, partial [Phenylobacterium sp.]|nr:acyl-CoA dehydrogenase family protein [Phenylobacterium sp.]
FIADHAPKSEAVKRANCWAVSDPVFSRALGEAGYIGMIWPKRYGGHERHPLERYVVLEEMLAAGAPVGMHWIADRQSGPLLLRYGTEEQRTRFLPAVARGELYACIGMSEPGAGSDLASVRTRGVRTNEGWRVSGQKLWTTNAHNAHVMIALVRTQEGSERQAGLTQFLIDLASPGVTVRPIIDLAGGHDFNEVFLDEVLVPDAMRVGEVGAGWKQVTAELSLERSGPERYLSSYALLVELVRAAGPKPEPVLAGLIGRATAELWTLRQMSMSTAAKLAAGEDPALEAAMTKDLGNAFEQALPRAVQAEVDADGGDLARVLSLLLQVSPSFSLRGGTREILRGIIARGLGLR